MQFKMLKQYKKKWPGSNLSNPSEPWEAIKFDFFDFQQPEKFKREQEKIKNPEILQTQHSNSKF